MLINYNGNVIITKKLKLEPEHIYIRRSWTVAKNNCSEQMSRYWVAWKFYGNTFPKEIQDIIENFI